ncbi:MAG: hypothetical protein N4A74_23690 [Carboxylicivirga sp.]|jgi:hypothetical protein|nr:hypothetical protein [Carboxylicivirga sp.]
MRIGLALIISCLILGCNHSNSNSSKLVPIDMQPNWSGVPLDNVPVKIGQILKFKNETIELTSVVLDFDQDEGGIWIGLCLINNNKLFGRQIPSGLINTTCLDLLDFSYLQLDGLKDYTVIDSINVKKNAVGIGSVSPVLDLVELKRNFDSGIKQRKKIQTPCEDVFAGIDAVRECYFDLSNIKN